MRQKQDISNVIARLCADTPGVWLGKAELLRLLSPYEKPATVFNLIRQAAKEGAPSIFRKGNRKGAKYAFGSEPVEAQLEIAETA